MKELLQNNRIEIFAAVFSDDSDIKNINRKEMSHMDKMAINTSESINRRINALQHKLMENSLDAAMIYDRENLIYFSGSDDLEGAVLVVPVEGEPELFCLWLDYESIKASSGIEKVVPYHFPKNNQSTMAANWLASQKWKSPRVGFTRYFISLKDYQCLIEAVPDVVICDIATICYEIRSVKDRNELFLMEKAGNAVSAGMKAAVQAIKPGMTEAEVLAEAEYAMRKAGSQGPSFRMQVLCHERQLQAHPYAGDYIIKNNEPVVIHLGATYRGYTAKMCRTVFLGEVYKEIVEVYEILLQAQMAAFHLLRPGVTAGDLYEVAHKVLLEHNYREPWIDHIGYGVGIRQSEFYPVIAKGSPVIIRENMVIDLLLPTIYRKNIGGPRITDTILVGKNENRFLTEYPRNPIYK